MIRFRSRDSLELQLLSDINCYGIVSRAIIKDTLVYCGMSQGGTGIEIYGVSNLAFPHLLSRVDLPPIMDIAVQDTFLYAIEYQQDSLRIFNVADPRNPAFVGACADSGFPMFVSGNYCYLAEQHGLNIIDVSNPANPSRAGNIGGYEVLSVAVRDTLCFFGTAANGLQVYNVKNPASPTPVGALAGIQPADLYLPPTCDTVLYSPKFDIINIADPGNPRLIGHVEAPGWDYGVRAVPALNYALVADYFEGLVAIDITTPSLPAIDTMLFAADLAEDIHINNDRAYVASYHAGLQMLDVSSPSSPRFLGSYDTTGTRPRMESATASDSFAYVSFYSSAMFRSVDVSNPRSPVLAGIAEGATDAKDMVLRDTFVYKVSMRNLQVVNVARPREPELVSTLILPDASYGMSLRDTLAYVTNWPLEIINVANPQNPTVVGSIWRGAWNVFVRDTFAYIAAGDLFTYSIANSSTPYQIDSMGFGQTAFDVVVIDTLAYVGCRDMLRLVSVADPRNPKLMGYHSLPRYAWRLFYSAPYVYAACAEAGICIFETTQVGIEEQDRIRISTSLEVNAVPNPTTHWVMLSLGYAGGTNADVVIRDVLGREVERISVEVGASQDTGIRLNIGELCAGVYFFELKLEAKTEIVKVVKQ